MNLLYYQMVQNVCRINHAGRQLCKLNAVKTAPWLCILRIATVIFFNFTTGMHHATIEPT